MAGPSREVSGSRKINLLADQSFASSLVVAISPGPTGSGSGIGTGFLSAAVVAGVAVSLPVLGSFADVPRIHHTAIRHTATTPVAERISQRGGICDIENLVDTAFDSAEGGEAWQTDSSLADTPGIFGSEGLNGLLFIPSPVAGFRKENIKVESCGTKTQGSNKKRC